MDGDGRPQGESGDGHWVGVAHGEGLESVKGQGCVGGDSRPQGEGGDRYKDEEWRMLCTLL